MRGVLFFLRNRHIIISLLLMVSLAGCGTLIPGPRYRVTIDDYTFNHDGSGVFYLEHRFRFFVYLRRYRERRFLYLYDVEDKKHRLVAETDAFSVSPFRAEILYAPSWRERNRAKSSLPDFYLFDCDSGLTRECYLPEGTVNGYDSYGFLYVKWKEEGGATAWVNFRYSPEKIATDWKCQSAEIPEWYTRLWIVDIPGPFPDDVALRARPCELSDVPVVPWRDLHRRKHRAGDGTRVLDFSTYNHYFSFASELALIDRETGEKEYVVRENAAVGLLQAVKYTLLYIPSAILHKLGLNYP